MLYAGSLDKAREIFTAAIKHRPRIRLTIRAFAIGAVMLQHFHYPQLDRFVPFWLGVQLFFVLSGFLITGILVRGQPTAEFIGGFYLRRGLRLFPLYFLVVAIIAVFSQELRDAWPYYTFYGVNFWVAQNMRWGVATHFWTLGVEEQFYLLWPLVVLFTPRRLLVYLCVSLIPIALAFCVAMQVLAQNSFGVVLLPGSVDSLACGARGTPPQVVRSIGTGGGLVPHRDLRP